MITQFDEKGKIYTNIIPKRPVPMTIQTITHKIHGEIHVKLNERIKDELNRSEPFLAVTNAVVFGLDGKELYHCNFLTLNLQHVVWLIPDDELESTQA
jgi:hypothetical protein